MKFSGFANQPTRSRKRAKSKRLVAVIAIISMAVTAVLLIQSYVVAASYGPAVNQSAEPLHPVATVLGGTSTASELGVPVTLVASSDNGSTTGPRTNAAGIAVTTFDTGHLMESLLTGDFGNGTSVIVVSLNDIGQQNVELGNLIIGASSAEGFTVVQSFVIGCTHNSTFLEPVTIVNPNGSSGTVVTTRTATFVCSQEASHEPVLLNPGETFTAYVKIPSSSLASFKYYGASVKYAVNGVAPEYILSASLDVPSVTS